MKKFEYTTRSYTGYVNYGYDLLNEMGEDGWELVSVDPDNMIMFFKREIPINIVRSTKCICIENKPNKLTGGFICPIHGQQF